MKHTLAFVLLLAMGSGAHGAVVSESWGGKGRALAHPGTLKMDTLGNVPRLLFDLSAIPRGAKVYHASLRFGARQGQPREPARIFPAETDAAPLALEKPYYRSFDATARVQRWVKDPSSNKGLTVDGLDPRGAVLDVRYEGKPKDLPPQVEGLRVVRRKGQTVLVFKELPGFRPSPDEVFYVTKWNKAGTVLAAEPGKDEMGNPTQPAIKLKTLRRLQGLKVRTTPGRGQEMPPHERVREVPHVRYRVYRSGEKITPATIGAAERVGEADPLCGYDHKMNIIFFSGEYYQKHERPETVIPTFCVDDLSGPTPGEAFYVHTPHQAGRFYYAVTAVRDGVENCANVTAANSLAEPVEERPGAPEPVKYFVTPSTVRARHDKTVEHWYLYWLAPPFTNVPSNLPRRIVAAVPAGFKEPGPLLIDMRGSIGREGHQADSTTALCLRMEVSGALAYNDGRGTLKSYRHSTVQTFTERHVFHVVHWARKRWRIDPARISGTKGMSIHVAIRHPELFGVFWPDRPEFYSNDFDSKWNPRSGSLGGTIGPPDLVRAPDGSPGWDIYNIAWYMGQDPGKDIPFMGCLFSQPKDGNHGAEYGWQDDPKGWAGLRDFRQPYVAQWGGGRIAGEVRGGLYGLRWDRSVPAFSNCTLDNNPGTGDPDAGEPWGQINGYLFWEYDSIVDTPGRWEMTVYLVASCPEPACKVDLTPRHRKAFHPAPGQKLAWTNTSLADEKPAGAGTVEADKWGLVTLKQITVTKGRNRIVIRKK